MSDWPLEDLTAAMFVGTLRRSAKWFRRCCPPPDPLESQEHLERFLHRDLERLSDFALWQQTRQAEEHLALDRDPHQWWFERFRRCEAERSRRERKVTE